MYSNLLPSADAPSSDALPSLPEDERFASALQSAQAGGLIADSINTAREILGMEIAYIADTRGGMQEYRAVSGDGESFGMATGRADPLDGSYCSLLLAGRLDGLVRDARSDHRVAGLVATRRADIGSYVGVPITLPDGEVYGTFCCLSHQPNPTLEEKELGFMRVLGRLIGAQLQRDELERADRRRELQQGTIGALLTALEARDGYTGEHSEAVVELAMAVAGEAGVPGEAMDDVEAAALLHDLGKIGVSDAVLNKPGKLSAEEWVQMRLHPEIGSRIVASMDNLAHLAPVIRAEHERWDGMGYPDGLTGDEIPLISRVVFVCDAFHAMTSDRPYRQAMLVEDAVAELSAAAGTQFCPGTVAALLRVLDPEA
jgi:hypothetical protein